MLLMLIVGICLGIVLLFLAIRFFLCDPECPKSYRLTGKTVVITDGNSPLGLAVTKELAKRGARIIMGCMDVVAGKDAALNLKADTNSDIQVHHCDPSSLRSIRQFCARILEDESEVHVLINTAHIQWVHNESFGVIEDSVREEAKSRSRHSLIGPESKGVFEAHWTHNYLSSFAFSQLLMPLLRRGGGTAPLLPLSADFASYSLGRQSGSGDQGCGGSEDGAELVKAESFNSRVICLTSTWRHRSPYLDCEAQEIGRLVLNKNKVGGLLAYAQSMRANLLFCQELARRCERSNVNTYCVDVGSISSGLDLKSLLLCKSNIVCPVVPLLCCLWLPFVKSASNAAQTIVYCASEWPTLNCRTGQLYRKCKPLSCSISVTSESTSAPSDDVESVHGPYETEAKRLWEMTERQVLLSS